MIRSRAAGLGAVLAGILLAPAAAQACSVPGRWTPEISVVSVPQGVVKPQGPLDRYYPSQALERGLAGTSVVRCRQGAARLEGCRVVAEEPRGAGFGSAGVRLAARLLPHPTPREGEVDLRFRWGVSVRKVKQVHCGGYHHVLEPGTYEWAEGPNFESLIRYPPRTDGPSEAEVVVRCGVLADGRLADCFALKPGPAGWDFDALAMRATSGMRLRLKDPKGRITPATVVDVPFRFTAG